MKYWTVGNRSRGKADLCLSDATVSTVHANLIRTDDGRWMVQDCNSTNGTARLVNGRWVPFKQAYVRSDERLRFGRAETTVRQLLAARHSDDETAAATPWRQDLTVALSQIRDMAELKRNLLFCVDLLSSPVERLIRCSSLRQPVNPFSFLMFGGLLYMLVVIAGFDVSSFAMVLTQGSWDGLASEISRRLNKFLDFILPIAVMFIFNAIPFPVFSRLLRQRYSFDDFMRLMAIVNGISLVLTSFWVLAKKSLFSFGELSAIVYILAGVIAGYLCWFNIMAQRQFWKVDYREAIIGYAVAASAFILTLLVLWWPILLYR